MSDSSPSPDLRGRLYVREGQAIAILALDGTLIRRVDGFRFAAPRPLQH